jgi:hypothetical protein
MQPPWLPFLVIVVTAIALVPGGAHFFELPNKINLPQAEYFTVQRIYAGWSLFGIPLFGALAANTTAALVYRGSATARILSIAAALLIAATLAIFFLWIWPANQETANWTTAPAHWEELRRAWEYSHAANAVLTFVALCAASAAGLCASAPRAG